MRQSIQSTLINSEQSVEFSEQFHIMSSLDPAGTLLAEVKNGAPHSLRRDEQHGLTPQHHQPRAPSSLSQAQLPPSQYSAKTYPTCAHTVPECQALTVTSALMLQKQLRLDMVHFPTALLLSLSWPPTNDAIVLPTAQANCHRLNVCISPKHVC